MEDLWCYDLLQGISKALDQANAPASFWGSFQHHVKIDTYLIATAKRMQNDLSLRKNTRMAMNATFTVHLVLSKSHTGITASIDGLEADRYSEYLGSIQKAVDDYMNQK